MASPVPTTPSEAWEFIKSHARMVGYGSKSPHEVAIWNAVCRLLEPLLSPSTLTNNALVPFVIGSVAYTKVGLHSHVNNDYVVAGIVTYITKETTIEGIFEYAVLRCDFGDIRVRLNLLRHSKEDAATLPEWSII